MKVQPYNIGACGLEQAMYAGKIAFNTAGVSDGVELCKIPANTVITRAVCKVKSVFNAATTNVLTIGTNATADNILGAADVTEGTVGAYQKNVWDENVAEASLKAKFTQTGAVATTGVAEVYIFFVRVPEE